MGITYLPTWKKSKYRFQTKEFREKTISSLSSLSSSIDIILTHGYPDKEILSKFPSHFLHVYGHSHNHYGIRRYIPSSSIAPPTAAASSKKEKEEKSSSYTIGGTTSRFDQVYQFKEETENSTSISNYNNRFSSRRTVVVAASKKLTNTELPASASASSPSPIISPLSLCVPVHDGHYHLSNLPMILDFPISMISEKNSIDNIDPKDGLGLVSTASRSSSTYLTEKEEDEIAVQKRRNNTNKENKKKRGNDEEEEKEIVERIKIKPENQRYQSSSQKEKEKDGEDDDDEHYDDGSADPSFSLFSHIFHPLIRYFLRSSSRGKKHYQQHQQQYHAKQAVHQYHRHYFKVFPLKKE
jgi:hypothetical protein